MAPLASAAEQLFSWDGGISHLETNSNPNAYCVQFKLLLYSRIKAEKCVSRPKCRPGGGGGDAERPPGGWPTAAGVAES